MQSPKALCQNLARMWVIVKKQWSSVALYIGCRSNANNRIHRFWTKIRKKCFGTRIETSALPLSDLHLLAPTQPDNKAFPQLSPTVICSSASPWSNVSKQTCMRRIFSWAHLFKSTHTLLCMWFWFSPSVSDILSSLLQLYALNEAFLSFS